MESANEIYSSIKSCASCNSVSLDVIYDFGQCPLAGYFPLPEKISNENLIEMKLMFCNSCELIQINPNVSDSYLFSDYRYRSSIGMKFHFNSLVKWLTDKSLISSNSKILEVGSNDGTLLLQLRDHGFNAVGIDPAVNITELAKKENLTVITGFFGTENLDTYNLREKFNVIISCNSFAHISDIADVAQAIHSSLLPDGLFIVEVQSLSALLNKKAIDFIYHEHKYYYSVKSLRNLMESVGLYLIDGCLIDTHGGSMRLVFSRVKTNLSDSMSKILEIEKNQEINPIKIRLAISQFMNQIIVVRNLLISEKNNGARIIAFGASGRGNMLLHYLGISHLIEFVYDESEERIGRQMALSNVNVSRFSELLPESYKVCLVLAWNYSEVIIAKWPHRGKKLIIPFPEISTFTS